MKKYILCGMLCLGSLLFSPGRGKVIGGQKRQKPSTPETQKIDQIDQITQSITNNVKSLKIIKEQVSGMQDKQNSEKPISQEQINKIGIEIDNLKSAFDGLNTELFGKEEKVAVTFSYEERKYQYTNEQYKKWTLKENDKILISFIKNKGQPFSLGEMKNVKDAVIDEKWLTQKIYDAAFDNKILQATSRGSAENSTLTIKVDGSNSEVTLILSFDEKGSVSGAKAIQRKYRSG